MSSLGKVYLRPSDKIRVGCFVGIAVFCGLVEFLFLTSVPYIFEFMGKAKDVGFCNNSDLYAPVCFFEGSFDYAILLMALFALLSAVLKLSLLWMTVGFSFEITRAWSEKIFAGLESASYASSSSIDRSNFVATVTQKLQACSTFIFIPIFNLISSFWLAAVIICSMFWINFSISAIAFGVILIFYIFMVVFVNPILKREGQEFAKSLDRKSEQASFLIENLKNLHFWGGVKSLLPAIYENDKALATSQTWSQFLGLSPRVLLEGLGLSLLFFWVFFMQPSDGGGKGLFTELLGLGLAAQRVLPSVQVIFNSVSALRFGNAAFADVAALLSRDWSPLPAQVDVAFSRSLRLQSVRYNYGGGTEFCLSTGDLVISKGEKILICGVSGDGKTTLVDIIMALRAPNEGRVFVDNEELRPEHFRSWYSKISYVSQTPFIFKGSLYENVTLRRDVSPSEIEGDTKFKDLVVQLSLSSVSSQSGAWISEGGTTLSGGQRQRIALARALYSDRPIVILDEFTSALDAQNSLRAQQLVNGENRKTFIIISHDTLSFISFNRVIRVTGGRVEELIGGE